MIARLATVFMCAMVANVRFTFGIDPFAKLFDSSIEELLELQPLQVQDGGTIPSWLKGRFIRNVPGRFEMEKRNFTMAFDGFGKIYGESPSFVCLLSVYLLTSSPLSRMASHGSRE